MSQATRCAIVAAGVIACEAAGLAMSALAGTTGGIGGRVTDEQTHNPLAGVSVEVTSPSGVAHAVTSAKGAYSIVSLLPDTYTVTASKDGYITYAQSGVTIQADVQQIFNITLQASVKTIGRVVSHPTTGLVRPGQTIDLYSVTPSQAQAAKPLAGPGSVDQSYGALAVVPGVYVPQAQQGWYQPIFMRGGDQDQIGYELDGVPVNRSYDNAPESMLSSVGQQELQVYTGGATASSEGQGISGYINQVVKSGTRTPSGSVTYALGFPTGYQKGAFEAGGAVPDGRFSYYVAGAIAYQSYRFVDQFNGVSLNNSGFFFPSFQFTTSGQPIDLTGLTLAASQTRDGEAVANLHFAIPHNGGASSDDLQLLYLSSNLYTYTYGSLSDFGGPATFGGTSFGYPDQYVYGGQLGAPLNIPSGLIQYFYPASPDVARAFQSQMSLNLRAVANNGFSLEKIQYQHNISPSSYLRVLGYSTYSNWFIQDAVPVPSTLQYILPEITFGGTVSYENQLSEKNLLTVTGSIESSKEYRYSTGFTFLLGGGFTSGNLIGGNFLQFGPGVQIGSFTDGTHCYNPTSGAYTSCYDSAGQAWMNPTNGGPLLDPTGSPLVTTPPAGSPASLHGAHWVATENGYAGLINQVSPILTSGSIADSIRPNDRLTLDLGARVERYDDRLVNEDDGYPTRPFWFAAANNEDCFAVANLPLNPIVTRTIDPTTGAAGPCPAGSTPIHLNLGNDSIESNSVFEPRIATTYQLSADTILRASYGTYARPPNASWVQYGTVQQDLATPMAQKFWAYGFTSPQHDLLPDVSHNVDLSWEQHIHGTDMSFKITPYYRGTMGQFENILLDQSGNESGVNIGSERSSGVEADFQAGNFNRDGWAGLVAFTYNNSHFWYANFASGLNVLGFINHAIQRYNAYTQACAPGGSAFGQSQFGSPVCGATTVGLGAAACFTPAGAPDPACVAGDTPNPYWKQNVQPLQDPSAPYRPYDVIPDQQLTAGNGFGPPVVGTLLLQYKHQRYALTPSLTYTSGTFYGAPLSTIGGDPALCPIASVALTSCSSTIVVPDAFTGQFDKMGAFMQPSRLTGNLSLGYAVTPQAQLTVTMTSLFDSCHQRGYAWDRGQFCSYTTLPFSQAPNSPTHTSALNDPNYMFPYTYQNGNNNTQYLGTTVPFQAYVTLQFKL